MIFWHWHKENSENKRAFHVDQCWWSRGETGLFLFVCSTLCLVSMLDLIKRSTKPCLVINGEGCEVATWSLGSAPSRSLGIYFRSYLNGPTGQNRPHISICLEDQTMEIYSPSITALMSQRTLSCFYRGLFVLMYYAAVHISKILIKK